MTVDLGPRMTVTLVTILASAIRTARRELVEILPDGKEWNVDANDWPLTTPGNRRHVQEAFDALTNAAEACDYAEQLAAEWAAAAKKFGGANP